MATASKINRRTCNICMDASKQPSTLSCQHTFCQECLTSYIKTQADAVKTKSIPCPTCRQQTPVPQPNRPVEEWVKQLKSGLHVTGLVDSDVLGNTEHCFMCKEEGETTPATHWCSECEASFCDGCLKLHGKVPASRHHDTIPLSAETPRTQLKKSHVCLEHDEKVTLFCRDCSKPLCTVCSSIGHRSCENVVTLQTLLTMLPEIKQDLQKRQMKLTEDIDKKSKKVDKDKNNIKTVLATTSEIKLDINETNEAFVNYFQRNRNELIEKVDEITEQETSRLQARVKSGEMEIQMYQQQAQLIQQTLNLKNEAQLYELYLSGSGAVADVTETQSDDEDDERNEFAKLKEEMSQMQSNIMDLNSSLQPYFLELVAVEYTGEDQPSPPEDWEF